jgi:hypothetical protein
VGDNETQRFPETEVNELPLLQNFFDNATPDVASPAAAPARGGYTRFLLPYSDEKVANRDIRVWHGAIENGP